MADDATNQGISSVQQLPEHSSEKPRLNAMIRVGILGCANIARRSLAPAFAAHKGFCLVAVASRTQDKAEELGACYKIRACTYDELIHADDIDLIYCPLPTGLHYEWVKKALLCSKHVLCEKSLACSYGQVSELVNLARSRHLLLMESFQFRFHAQNLFVRDQLDSGAIGDVIKMKARFSFPAFPDKNNIRYFKSLGGGALLDTGAYAIKASTYILGPNLKVVSAETSVDADWKVDKDGKLLLVRPDGVCAEASYSMDSTYCCGYEIMGTHGYITTTRAFTARADFAAEVCVSIDGDARTYQFRDDHFARLLDYVNKTIHYSDFEREYAENLTQAMLISQTAKHLGFDLVNRFAVFGGRGYLGSQLAAWLSSHDTICDIYDLPESDVTSDEFWAGFDLFRYSSILFFSGLTGTFASNANREKFTSVNEGGLKRLIERIRHLGRSAPKIIFPSTRLVYKGRDFPLQEDADKEAKTVYAENKLNCERMLEQSGLPYVVVRICVPYGNVITHDYSYGTIGFMLKQAKDGRITLFGDGSIRRTFTHVADICKAVEALASKEIPNGIFNIGGTNASLKDVATLIAAQANAEIAFIDWPPEALKIESGSTVFDSRKLDELLPSLDYCNIRTWLEKERIHGND